MGGIDIEMSQNTSALDKGNTTHGEDEYVIPGHDPEKQNLLLWALPTIIKEIGNRIKDVGGFDKLSRRERRDQVWTMAESASNHLNMIHTPLGVPLTRSERAWIAQAACNEILGWGPLQPLMNDPSVTEIMVNGPEKVFIEKHGKIIKVPVRFRDDKHVMNLIHKIVSPLGRRIDMTSPMVDARLPDGSRVNAVISPISMLGPSLTIRRFSEQMLTLADLLSMGVLTESMAAFLALAIEARLNVVVSGGTGAGKTTLLNVLAGMASTGERIVTVEDSAELRIHHTHPNVVVLEAKQRNVEGRGEITIRELVRNALRMRPDRVIVGEVRGAEALDMLHAMNTGHDGSFTTVHANTARDVFTRIETMVCMSAPEIPIQSVRDLIASAIHLVVHVSRLRDGSRKIVQIVEVAGLDTTGRIMVNPIWIYRAKSTGQDGKLIGRYHFHQIPSLTAERMQSHGVEIVYPLRYTPNVGAEASGEDRRDGERPQSESAVAQEPSIVLDSEAISVPEPHPAPAVNEEPDDAPGASPDIAVAKDYASLSEGPTQPESPLDEEQPVSKQAPELDFEEINLTAERPFAEAAPEVDTDYIDGAAEAFDDERKTERRAKKDVKTDAPDLSNSLYRTKKEQEGQAMLKDIRSRSESSNSTSLRSLFKTEQLRSLIQKRKQRNREEENEE